MLYRRILFFLIFLTLTSDARENPFFPSEENPVPSYSTNKIQKPQTFRSLSIKLPDSVRILESVTLKCKNIDGLITTKTIPIHKSVDWHQPVIITQHPFSQSIKSSANKGQRKSTQPKFQKLAKLRFISFYTTYKEMKIYTRDKLLRHFKLVKPDRIVLDFKRDAGFRTYTFKGKKVFQKIKIGNHNGYYRVVITLDGKYIYEIKPIKNGYRLHVR